MEIFTANPHDHGLDLIPGRDITNRPVGRIFWDDDPAQPGMVVRLHNEEMYPDSGGELSRELASRGYEIGRESLRQIADLLPDYGDEYVTCRALWSIDAILDRD